MTSAKKHAGYTYWYELYLTKDACDAAGWRSIILTLSQHIGLLRHFAIALEIKGSTVHYYVGSNRDISILSDDMDGAILRPIDHEQIAIPASSKKEPFIQFASGNLIATREKYAVKRGLELEWALFRVRVYDATRSYCSIELAFKNGKSSTYSIAQKQSLALPSSLLAFDFTANPKYMRVKQPQYLNIQKSLDTLHSTKEGAIFEVDTFPYLPKNYFLTLDSYDFAMHSFIIGASGSGKSKLISLFIQKLFARPENYEKYRVVVIDPHASLENDLQHINGNNIIRFKNGDDSAELFAGAGTDISAATELTGTLFKSLLADQYSPKLERVLRFSLYVLMTAQVMTLDNLKRFLTDIEYRDQLLKHVAGYVPANILRFFGGDFNELRTKYYNESISPIVSLVEEMQLQPSLSQEFDDASSLNALINKNPLTVFSLNKVSMGDKVVKTVAGLLIQQIFLLAQSKSFAEKVILIIDEVSVVQNPALAQILAEARKYNLFVFLTQQYFGQIDKPLQDAIFTNVANYYVFRVSEEDARALEGNLTIELPKEAVLEEKEIGNKENELRVRMLTSLNSRECLVRMSANGNILPCIKAKTVDYAGTKGAAAVQHLDEFKQSNMPTKFQEHMTHIITQNNPQVSMLVSPVEHVAPKATMQDLRAFLRAQSSNHPEPVPLEAISQHSIYSDAGVLSISDVIAGQSYNPTNKNRKEPLT